MSVVRDRQDKLLKLVAVFPLKANALATMLDVHVRTVYKDIEYLSSRNKIKVANDVFGMEVSAL